MTSFSYKMALEYQSDGGKISAMFAKKFGKKNSGRVCNTLKKLILDSSLHMTLFLLNQILNEANNLEVFQFHMELSYDRILRPQILHLNDWN